MDSRPRTVTRRFLKRIGAPPFTWNGMIDVLAENTKIPATTFPDPSFTRARLDKHARRMPQCIAHRGFKAKYPENTMVAFQAAIDAGVHALETDVHITKDEIVVLSHDPTLSRCFGVHRRIIDCDWSFVSQQRTTAKPHEPMPRLLDLLQYLAQPGIQDKWLLLDIKTDNDPEDIMRLMAKTLSQVEAPDGTRWEERIVLGCWATKFIGPCHKHFPGFPITNISFSVLYSSQFLSVPNISFNMLFESLTSPWGRQFIKKAKSKNREVYAWTVNQEKFMDWCIRKELDGVITDEPIKFLDLCDRWEASKRPTYTTRLVLTLLRINMFMTIFGWMIQWRKGSEGLKSENIVEKEQ